LKFEIKWYSLDSNDLQTAEEMLDKAKSFEINAPPSIEFYLTNARLVSPAFDITSFV
jgi:hypothetical protein